VTKLIPVSEIYGPVVQGEGPLTGRPTVFVRVGGCDDRCVWCDSKYAVEAEYAKTWEKLTEDQIVERVSECTGPLSVPGHVTLSGGNPALYELSLLVNTLRQSGYEIAIETQGTRFSFWIANLDHVIVSPKPPSSGNQTPYDPQSQLRLFVKTCFEDARYHGWEYPKLFALKIVVFGRKDFSYARSVHEAYPDVPMWVQVGTSVGKDEPHHLIEKLIRLQEMVLRDPVMFDVHATIQTHVLLHGHKRGI